MTTHAIHFGPRLVGTPTGKLRAALLVRPTIAIEAAQPIAGEPGAVYSRALEQHEILRKTLAFFGVETMVLDSHSDDPLESAVADAAITFEDGAMMTRPSAMSRRGEADRIAAEFAKTDVPVAGHVAAPGLFDGGDVVLVGKTAFVGAGLRGNALGRSGFTSVAQAHGYAVIEVRLAADAPPLRTIVGALASDTVSIACEYVDPSAFVDFKTIVLERGEAMAAGVLSLGEHHVIADVRYRTALAQMRRAGIVVEGIDLYDFEKVGITPSMLALALKRD
jgi:dimethylargininase